MSNFKEPYLIVILGPTASGKSNLAVKLTKKFSGEIVSADSRQIYQEMNIGTAKASLEQRKLIPHHLIDIVNPDENFTLSDYKKMTIEKINDIHSRGKIPFLVGGTGLYISAIIDNLNIPEVAPDQKLREELEKKEIKDLQKELKILDPDFYKKIDLNNRRRLIRAIEVCRIANKPFSSLREKGKTLFNILRIGVDVPREKLNEKINKRIDEMRKNGLEKEVKNLSKKYSWDLLSMSGIGYQEFRSYVERDKNSPEELDKIFEEIKKHTRQYAKKQMTWFRRDRNIQWISDYDKTELLVNNFLF